MTSYTRTGADLKLREVRAQLEAVDFPIPNAVADAFDAITRHRAIKPAQVTAKDVREAYVAGDDPADIDALAVRASVGTMQVHAWGEALTDLSLAALSTIREHGADVIEHVRPDAERIIANVTWWAQAGCPSAGTLLGHNKVADAKRAAAIESEWVTLMSLRKLRASVTHKTFPWVRLAFTAPVEHVLPGDLTSTTQAIANGAEMWWPSWDEAVKAQQSLEMSDAKRAEAERIERQLQRQSAI